jgi:NAD(P)-dependent dehydrogenase (short-subunit alcohol dehydrogenase family)
MGNRIDLEGCTAVVTGGAQGFGRAITERFAASGAKVAIWDRDIALAERTAAELGERVTAIVCDVTDPAKVAVARDATVSRLGRIDILVNNAGVGGFAAPLHEMTPEIWEKILNTNLRGVFYCIRSLAPLMIRGGGGHIVNISSLAGKNALPNGAAYAASKWGLNGLSYSVAEELRGHHIRVSVVCPGSVDTELSPHTGKDSTKMLKPEDVAHVVAMLVTQAPQSFASEVLLRPTQKP